MDNAFVESKKEAIELFLTFVGGAQSAKCEGLFGAAGRSEGDSSHSTQCACVRQTSGRGRGRCASDID